MRDGHDNEPTPDRGIAVFPGANTMRPLPMDGVPQPIALFSVINGATLPFTFALVGFALIGAVIADLINVRRRPGP